MKLQQIHLKVSGRVQGVGFRQNTFLQALKLGLVGWVRNTSDGKVEIVAVSDPETLQRFTEWCQEGPPHAQVTGVEVLEIKDLEAKSFETFRIESTG